MHVNVCRWRNAEHTLMIVVVDFVPITAVFTQAALVPPPLLTTATGPYTVSLLRRLWAAAFAPLVPLQSSIA